MVTGILGGVKYEVSISRTHATIRFSEELKGGWEGFWVEVGAPDLCLELCMTYDSILKESFVKGNKNGKIFEDL